MTACLTRTPSASRTARWRASCVAIRISASALFGSDRMVTALLLRASPAGRGLLGRGAAHGSLLGFVTGGRPADLVLRRDLLQTCRQVRHVLVDQLPDLI